MRNDDPQDFATWVDARRGALWRSAWLLTGDTHRAEDLVQTALAKVWPRWSRVLAGGDPEPYVRRVMYTTYVTWWRRRWNAEEPTVIRSDAATPEQDVDLQRDLARALATLPRGQRAVVVLRFFDDLTEAQTAQVLGCSVSSVKTQTSRALAKLRTSPLLDRATDREDVP